ncbi:MAG: response regulator [Chloroflexota bacterium]|nr:MAG: response regulator [Chloroflexota bacterium]
MNSDNSRPKILVAEDEPDIRELIAIALQFGGFEVEAAADGIEALALAEAKAFDLIILDVRMPRMTGFEACRELRLREATRKTPIIFLSAKGQESEVQAGLDAGADEYIVKPFAPHELAERVRVTLENQPA